MSLSQKNLSSIQKAGQAVHGASEAIAATVRTQAESMVASVASQPFGVESEQSIARFKVLARLSQGLVTVEAQLQELYALAADLANPASDVIILPALSKRKAASDGVAVDVVAKPARLAKKVKKPARTAVTLTANDNKLLRFLQGALKGRDVTVLTGAAMADGSGLPLGSVGLSLKKLLASGAVKLTGRGAYQWGATASAAATQPAARKNAPTEKAQPAAARKAKAAAVPATKQVKARPVQKTKAAPAKKAAPVVAPVAEVPAEAAAATL